MPITDYKAEADKAYQRFLANPAISKKNKSDFELFLNARRLSGGRLEITIAGLSILFRYMPDAVGSMLNRDYVNRTFKQIMEKETDGYYESAKKEGKTFVRYFNDDENPKGWKDIKRKPYAKSLRKLDPADMWTWEDGLKLIDQTQSAQFKAIVMAQLDGGFRPSEFVDLNYGDVELQEGIAIVRVKDGKTGRRDVILYKSLPYLSRWLEAHPMKDKDAPLWILENNKYANKGSRKEKYSLSNKQGHFRYSYAAIKKRIQYLAKIAGIPKPTDFYALRHSAVVLAKMDNIDSDLSTKRFGHSAKFFHTVYGRLTTADDVKRMKKAYGLHNPDEKEEKKEQHNPIQCSRCKTVNLPLALICVQCGSPLTLNQALQSYSRLERIERILEFMIKQNPIKDEAEFIKLLEKH